MLTALPLGHPLIATQYVHVKDDGETRSVMLSLRQKQHLIAHG